MSSATTPPFSRSNRARVALRFELRIRLGLGLGYYEWGLQPRIPYVAEKDLVPPHLGRHACAPAQHILHLSRLLKSWWGIMWFHA